MFSSNTSQVASSSANYVEDVFSTYLVTTPGGAYTVPSGIDFTKDGGLVWTKDRTLSSSHYLYGKTGTGNFVSELSSNNTNAASTGFTYLTALSNGFTDNVQTTAGRSLVHWQFRKQAKFFDVVTYTGTGSNTTIAHNLGSTPGCIIVKRTDTTGNWQVYHRGLTSAAYAVQVNLSTSQTLLTDVWNSTAPTSTVFSVGTNAGVNASGGTYVAYIFAHNAGGFGLTGSDNVISCGSFTATGAGGASVTLGYEPQWILIKNISVSSTWLLEDVMRGMPAGGDLANGLFPNTSGIEGTSNTPYQPNATGFTVPDGNLTSGNNFIYIAIRRGPMKVPTSGTSVYEAVTRTGTGANATVTTGFPVDLFIVQPRTNLAGTAPSWINRVAGGDLYLRSSATFAEATLGVSAFGTVMNGVSLGGDTETNYSPSTFVNWFFKRAPSFMDVVCYTGTNNDIALTHNLGVAPEAIILKKRNSTGDWAYETNFTSTQHTYLTLNDTIAGSTANYSGGVNLAAQPTSTTVTVAGGSYSTSGSTYVMYMFATCAGVSKVGSYTGSGTTKQIDCGFTGGARFVLIKRTDSTGAWYVWDSARGIVSGNDPYLLLNSTAAEVTNTDYVDTYSAGFEISSTAPAAINANGGSFIFFAVA